MSELPPKKFLEEMEKREGEKKRSPWTSWLIYVGLAVGVAVFFAPYVMFPKVLFPIMVLDAIVIGGLIVFYFFTRQ